MTLNTAGLLAPQFEHTKRLIDSIYLNGYAFDLSETGTGKSYVAAAVARAMNKPLVIICPKTIIPQWRKIAALFGLNPLIINYEKIGRGNTEYMRWEHLPDPMHPWDVTIRKELPSFKFPKNSFIILDEGHRCKGQETTNSWMMVSLALQGYRVLMSSATAATSPLEMKALGFLCGMHRLYNFTEWCLMHGGQWMGNYGAITWDMDSRDAYAAMLGLNQYMFDRRKCASRMTVEDFGNLFPESHVVAEAYSMGSNEPKMQAVYENMESEIARLNERAEGYRNHVFAVLMKARRESELLKVPLFVEMIEDLFDENKSVVIFLNFTETIEAVANRLAKKYRPHIGYIVGGQSENARQNDIDNFNSDKKRIMITQISAGGVGVSLHDLNGKFSRASIVSPNFSAFQLVQALGRIWRTGGLTKVYQRIVYAANTIEERACRRVQFKINSLATLNDADMIAGIQIF